MRGRQVETPIRAYVYFLDVGYFSTGSVRTSTWLWGKDGGKGRREGDFNQFITLECKELLTDKCCIFTPKKELRQNETNGGTMIIPE